MLAKWPGTKLDDDLSFVDPSVWLKFLGRTVWNLSGSRKLHDTER